MNEETAKLAQEMHAASFEVERELGFPYRDFITFAGMPFEYQTLVLKTIEKLLEKGVIEIGDAIRSVQE